VAVAWHRPLRPASAHAHVELQPLAASPTPAPSPIADYAWINANPNYGEIWGLQTGDQNCKTITWSYSTTIPSQDVSYYFYPPTTAPNQTTQLSISQTASIAPKIYSQTVNAVCNDGHGPGPKMNTFAVVQLDWHDTIANKTVTNTTQTSYAGALTSLKIKTNPTTQVVPIPQVAPYNIWSVTGSDAAVKTYEQTYSRGSYTPMDMAVNPSLYWIYSSATGNYGNASTIYVLAEVLGGVQGDTVDAFEGAGSVSVSYNVLGPTNVSMVSTTGSVQLGPAYSEGGALALSFGDIPPGTPGISWVFTATGPAGVAGQISAIQVLTTKQKQTVISTAPPTAAPVDNTGSTYRLDEPIAGDILYANTFSQLPASTTGTWSNIDAPVKALWDLGYFTRSDQFQTWFVYKPTLNDSIWVPLGYVPWNWSGTATLSGSTWTLSGQTWSQNPAATIPNAYTSIPFPAWSGHLP